jgi:hypothetical protein
MHFIGFLTFEENKSNQSLKTVNLPSYALIDWRLVAVIRTLISEYSPEAEFMDVLYNFDEVSRHNIESSQTLGFCMDFLNYRKGGMIFYQVFLLFALKGTVTEQ